MSGIYAGTQFFVGIFDGIFARTGTGSAGTLAVFEPATLIAMLVVGLVAWVVLKLMSPRAGTRSETTEYTEYDGQEK